MHSRSSLQPWLSQVLRWPTSASRDWAIRVFPELCANRRVVAVVLLGSTIRPAESSYDLDCLFLYQGMRPSFEKPPADVDIRGFDIEKVDQLISSGHDLLVWSVRFGKLVCEHDDAWTRILTKWRDALPLPSASVADDRAEKAERMLAELSAIGDEDAAIEQLVTALTHRARATLLRADVFPASRPELPGQLRAIGHLDLASTLDVAIRRRNAMAHQTAASSLTRTTNDAA